MTLPTTSPVPDSAAAAWMQALSLYERLPNAPTGQATDERLQQWRADMAAPDDEALAANLQREDLTLQTLAGLLAEPAEDLHTRLPDPLPWLTDLYAAYGADATGTLFRDEHLAGAGFAVLVEPLLLWARKELATQLAPLLADPNVPFSLDVAQRALLDTLLQQLTPLLNRTLVLELNVARLQGQLVGETAGERFVSFLHRLRQPTVALALYAEYPVLARQLVTKVRQTSTAMQEILTHLVADWDELCAQFASDGHLGELVEVELGAGDTHRDGRTVAILRFMDAQRVVYKPRSLAIDVHFQALLRWLNEHGAHPNFRPLSVIDCASYGWIEFVAAAPCADEEELERFYTRQGGYLALLHLLSAADFHFENLIASGEHPQLIDLEALFHPDIMEYDPSNPGELAQQALDHSVLSIGMLPQRLRFHADAATIDISGLGAAGTQLTPDKLPVWEGVGTDEMHLTRRHIEFSSDGHRPSVAGQEVDVRQYGGAVAHGFDQVYRLLLAHRDALLAADGPLASFAGAEMRVVARATRIYSLLLQESTHPDLLRNALERDRLYGRLWRDVALSPRLARLIPSERRDMHNGDVPIFHALPASTSLWDSRGAEIPNFLPQSGLDRVTERIASMGETDLARQLWYIHASFAAIDGDNSHRQVATTPTMSSTLGGAVDDPAIATQFTAQARHIGDHLARLAHRYEQHAVWIGLGLDAHETWSLAPLTMHLYDGHAGLAFFYAYLNKVTGEASYRELAEAALATTLVQGEGLTHFNYIGGFSGWGGLVYTLAHLGACWQRPDLWDQAQHFTEIATTHVAQDQQFDVIGGAAGCIGAAASLYACTESTTALTLIDQCAAHLTAHAQPMDTGVGWVVPNMGGKPLAGFSHGVAGMGWALLQAANLCGNDEYRQVAQQALAYERSLYVPTAENWRDLRSDGSDATTDDTPTDSAEKFMHAWCHGAPGIGLSRLAMLDHSDDPLLAADLADALHSTEAHGFGRGHCLCHGDLGNLDLLVSTAHRRDDQSLRHKTHQLTQQILADQATRGWLCGVPGGVETPGLMVGLAGIGYEFLRLASPETVPSILMMEAPPV